MPAALATMKRLPWLVFLFALPAAAEEPGTYEARHLARALHDMKALADPLPEGKTVGRVHVVRYEVFLADEPFFTFPNMLHWLTEESVIRDEILLRSGQPYDAAKAMETARNLRDLRIFSVVAVTPVLAEDPKTVDVLVVTRDLWSLRLEWNLQFTDAHIDQLLMQITERNLFGRNKRATIRTLVRPLDWSLGEVYVDRRLLGMGVQLEQTGDLFFRRQDNSFDGYSLFLDVQRPFYDLEQQWGFRAPVRVERRVARQVRDAQVLTYDDPDTVDVEEIRRVWDSDFISLSLSGRLQISGALTQRMSFGMGFGRLDVEPNAETKLPEENAASFRRDVLPRALTEVFPVVGWSGFWREYRTFTGLSSYGVSEDVRLGPSLSLTATLPLEAIGSDVDALELYGGATWAEDFAGDGLVEVGFGAEARFESGEWIDRELLLRLRAATPRYSFGRLVARADWLDQTADTSNSLVTLGGHNGLRGYPSQAFFTVGGDRLRANMEYRSAPWVWHYLHVGGVVFYDAGDVYDAERSFALKQSVGVGLRGLMPQFNREVFRLDVGMPVDGSGFMVTISGGTGQAVPMTHREDLQFAHSVGSLSNQP